MILIFCKPNVKERYFGNISFDGVKFVNSEDEADFSVIKGDGSEKFNKNNIYLLNGVKRVRTGWNLRNGFCVDNNIDLPDLQNFYFSPLDICNKPYIISTPSGPTNHNSVSQKPQYWLDYNIKNTDFHNRVYWCGRISSHATRKELYDFYNTVDDDRFNIIKFTSNVYQNETSPNIYTDYIEELSKSDISFVLRGDKTFANSFFDVIMAGCIPVMISSMNYYGWENIFENVDDYMLRFDLREHSMEYIHEQVELLLEDKERVLRMKANIANFYNTFFKHSARFGFGEFLLAKCIEIYKNDFDLERVDDKFICSEILTLKGFNNKL